MRTAPRWAVAITIASGITFGQEKPKDQVNVLTVCEVLGDLTRYRDTAVAVVGRMERSVSLIDHYELLSQDGCEHPVITHGHVWSNKVQVWSDWEKGMPKPPSDRPKLEQAVLAAKLSVISKTTRLGFHDERRFKTEAHSIVYSHTAAVPNEWAVVYGRIVTVPELNEDCGAKGCGGDDVPLVIIAEPSQIQKLSADGRPFREGK